MNVSAVMAREVQSVEASASLVEAAQRMRENNVGFLPVIEGGALAGVVTDRDMVVRGLAEASDPAKISVRDVMSVEVVCCFDDQTTDQAKRLMAEYNIRHLPVIDKGHRVVGIVSTGNIEGRTGTKKRPVSVTFHKVKDRRLRA